MVEHLLCSIALRNSSLDLDVNFTVTAPWTCLFGASGSGKSTILRCIAGFVRPDRGRILIGPQLEDDKPGVFFDHTSSISIPPHKRAVRSASQQVWLFPGTVRQNIRYGVKPKAWQECVEPLADRLRLTKLLDTNVARLSGGERQRVSLARAIAAAVHGAEPVRLLLLDEPFTGMDTAMRDELVVEISTWLATIGLPVLSVTHDIAEAFLLEAEVIRIANGKVLDQGPVDRVLRDEVTRLRAILD